MKNTNLNRFFAAENISYDLDSYRTQCNRNFLIVGGSGTGKTRSQVTINLLACNGSYVVSDPKGNLYSKYHKAMESEGYKTYLVDFINPARGEGYNFFQDLCTEDDFLRVADTIVRIHSNKGSTDSAFWDATETFTIAGILALIKDLQNIMESVPDEIPDVCEISDRRFSYVDIVAKRFLRQGDLRYQRTIGGMTRLLDDMSTEFFIDPVVRQDCIEHYMQQYLNTLSSAAIGNHGMRDLLSLIHSAKEQNYPNLTTLIHGLNDIFTATAQAGAYSSDAQSRNAANAFLRYAINGAVNLLRDIERHDMFTHFALLKALRPNSFGARQIDRVMNLSAEKTASNIIISTHAALARYDSSAINSMMERAEKHAFDFTRTGREKTAVFVCVSDTDRKMDGFANIFYTLFLQKLCTYADTACGQNCSLPVPVTFIFDDFGTNVKISEFPRQISSFRSRNIGVMLLIQAESQLEQYYGYDAKTIIANCDTYIYLGGSDLMNARSISERTDRPVQDILYMPVGSNIIFRRGEQPQFGRNIDHDRFLKWIGFEETYPASHPVKTSERAPAV